MSTTDEEDHCVHCGQTLEKHIYRSGWAVFACPDNFQQIYLAPWQVDAGHCVRCGHEREHHFRDGQCRWFTGQTFLAATPSYPQVTQDMQAWDEVAETMRQAMSRP